jgi:hypothetical protein
VKREHGLRRTRLRVNIKYTHLELNKEISCVAGFYTPQKEVRLKYDDREVLYVTGRAVIESSCCGVGNWGYALVPGYIVSWQNERNTADLPVSEVEPIFSEVVRNSITKIIKETENINQIEFWQA